MAGAGSGGPRPPAGAPRGGGRIVLGGGGWAAPVLSRAHGRAQAWHQPGSALWRACEARGLTPIQFRWSGYCGGVPGPVIVPPDTDDLKGALRLWQSEGEKLALFCQRLGLEAPDVISHSHGLQVVAFAASGVGGLCMAQRFGTVPSLSGPVRRGMAWVRG